MKEETTCIPFYEYSCSNCGYRETKLQNIEERDTEKRCPKCDAKLTREFGIAMGVRRGPAE